MGDLMARWAGDEDLTSPASTRITIFATFPVSLLDQLELRSPMEKNDGRRTQPAGLAQEKTRQRGATAPIALWNPSDQVRDLAGDLGLRRHSPLLLACPLALAVRDRNAVHPAPSRRDEEQLHVEAAVSGQRASEIVPPEVAQLLPAAQQPAILAIADEAGAKKPRKRRQKNIAVESKQDP